MTTPDTRPLVAATPANGYVVHAIRQPDADPAHTFPLAPSVGVYRATSLCGVRGLDALRWGGFRRFPPKPGQPWVAFSEDVAPFDRGAAHPICLSCFRRWRRITGATQTAPVSDVTFDNPVTMQGETR